MKVVSDRKYTVYNEMRVLDNEYTVCAVLVVGTSAVYYLYRY